MKHEWNVQELYKLRGSKNKCLFYLCHQATQHVVHHEIIKQCSKCHLITLMNYEK